MYLSWFDIEVEHQFFTSGMGRTFTVSPTRKTAELAQEMGLRTRETPNGIHVVYEVQQFEALQRRIDHDPTGLQLGFKLETTDRLFEMYTEPLCAPDSLFNFESSEAEVESDEISRLHREPHVSIHEVEPLESPRIEARLEKQEQMARPLGLIHISLEPSAGGVLDAQLKARPRTYHIRFAARKTYWAYYLLDDLARDDLYIEDAKEVVEFDAVGEEALPDNRVARVFQTTSMLAVQDRYHNRFQIVEPGPNGGRILIARLPGPSVRQASQARWGEADRKISKIFITG